MTIGLVYYVHYIISWTNWWYYNSCKYWGGAFSIKRTYKEEYESISSSIDELYIEDDFGDGYIITNNLEDIWYGSQIHPDINARDARLKNVTVLKKYKVNGKEQNYQRRGWEKV